MCGQLLKVCNEGRKKRVFGILGVHVAVVAPVFDRSLVDSEGARGTTRIGGFLLHLHLLHILVSFTNMCLFVLLMANPRHPASSSLSLRFCDSCLVVLLNYMLSFWKFLCRMFFGSPFCVFELLKKVGTFFSF